MINTGYHPPLQSPPVLSRVPVTQSLVFSVPESPPVLSRVPVTQSLVFSVVSSEPFFVTGPL
jgi:hypothetical protein